MRTAPCVSHTEHLQAPKVAPNVPSPMASRPAADMRDHPARGTGSATGSRKTQADPQRRGTCPLARSPVATPAEHVGPGRQPGQAGPAYQVLQSTLILAPGEYRSLLWTQGHSFSSTQPPRPSSISPSGHTQPLIHSVWYWRQPESGVQGWTGEAAALPELPSLQPTCSPSGLDTKPGKA